MALPVAFLGSDLRQELERRRNRGKRTVVTGLDLDCTTIHPNRDSGPFFIRLRESAIPLGIVTGLDFPAVRTRIMNGVLPPPHLIAGSVGTELYLRHERYPEHMPDHLVLSVNGPNGVVFYARDEGWDNEVAARPFNRAAICIGLLNFAHYLHSEGYGLVFQQPEAEKEYLMTGELPEVLKSQRYKVSCHFWSSYPQQIDFLVQLVRQQTNQVVITCIERNYQLEHPDARPQKYCLDVLPVSKAEVLHYVRRVLQPDVVVTAGDSGNDTQLVLGPWELAIVVGGASDELVNATRLHLPLYGFSRGPLAFEQGNNQGKALYLEQDSQRLGPDSLEHAMAAYGLFD